MAPGSDHHAPAAGPAGGAVLNARSAYFDYRAAFILAAVVAGGPSAASGAVSNAGSSAYFDYGADGTTGNGASVGGAVRAVAYTSQGSNTQGSPAALYAGGVAMSPQSGAGLSWTFSGDSSTAQLPAAGNSFGAADALLVKLDPTGKASWSLAFGTSGDDWVADVAVAPAGVSLNGVTGGVVVAGVTAGNTYAQQFASYGGSNVQISGSYDSIGLKATPAGFVMLVGNGGAPSWVRRVGGNAPAASLTALPPATNSPWALADPFPARTGSALLYPYQTDGAFGVAVSGAGEVFAAGQLGPSTTFVSDGGAYITTGLNSSTVNAVQTITNVARVGFDAVLGKWSATGQLIWHLRMYGDGTASHDGAFGVAVSPTDNGAAVVGASMSTLLKFQTVQPTGGTVNVGTFPAATATVQSTSVGLLYGSATSAGFLARTDIAGNLQWAVGLLGDNSAAAYGVAFDANNAVFACGTFGYKFRVQPSGSTTQPANVLLTTSSTGVAGFVAKFSSTGALVWTAMAGGGAPGDGVWRVATDSTNDVYIFGSITSNTASIASGSISNNKAGGGALGFVAKLTGAGGSNGAGVAVWNATAWSPGAGATGVVTRTIMAGAVADSSTVFWGGVLSQSSTTVSPATLTAACGNTTTVGLQPAAKAMPFVGAFAAGVSCGLSGGSSGQIVTGGDGSQQSSASAAPPWVVAAPSNSSQTILQPRAVALSADGASVFAGGWVQSSYGAATSVYVSNNTQPSFAASKLYVPNSNARTEALIFSVSATNGSPLWNMSFGGTGDDTVLDLAAAGPSAALANKAVVFAGGRFAGGTVTLTKAPGVTAPQTLLSADSVQAPNPAGFVAIIDATKGGSYAALTIGGNNAASGATFTYGASDSAQLANTPFANMSTKAIDGVNGVAFGANSAGGLALYAAATLGMDAPNFCNDPNAGRAGNTLALAFKLRSDQTYASVRTTDAFVAQFSVSNAPALSLAWLVAIGGSGAGDHDAALGVAADAGPQGGVLAVGASTSAVVSLQSANGQGDSPTLRRLQGNAFGWAVKLTATGSPAWAVAFTCTGASAVYGAAVDGSSNAFVAGSYSGAMTIVPSGTSTLPQQNPDAPATNGASNAFVTKLSASGTAMWTQALSGTGNDGFARVALDTAFDVYAFGAFTSPTLQSANAQIKLSCTGPRDGVVARFAGNNGDAQWALGAQSSGDDAGLGGAVQGSAQNNGGIFMAGSTSSVGTSSTTVVMATTCNKPVSINGVQGLGWLLQTPMRQQDGLCPNNTSSNSGGNGPVGTLPPAAAGESVFNVPLTLSVSDPGAFDGQAAASALAATLGLPSSNVIVTGGSAMMTFTLSFSGASSLSASVQNDLATFIASGFNIPNASAVTFAAAAAPLAGRRRALLQTSSSSSSGSVLVTAGAIPYTSFSLLSMLSPSLMQNNLGPVLSNSGLAIGTVGSPAFTITAFFSVLSTNNPSTSLSTSAGSASLLAALISAGVPTSGVAVTSSPTACSPSPCSTGATCTVAGGAAVCTCPVGTYDDGSACTSCGALPAPTLSLGFTSPINRGTAASFYGQASVPTASNCVLGSGFTYAWSVLDGAGAAAASGSGQSLSLAAGSLAVGTSASVSLQVCLVNSTLTCATTTVPFTVAVTPLVAAVSGGGSITAGAAASLDASKSLDPDAPTAGGLTYSWTCALTGGGACVDASGATLSFPATAQISLSSLPGAASPGRSYTFTLAVSKDVRTASATAAVTVLSDGGARAVVKIDALPQASVNPSSRTVLSATVTPAAASDTVALQWSVAPSSAASIDLTNPALVSTPLSFSSIAFLPDALSGGLTYVFRLTATATSAAGVVTTSFGEIVVPTTVAYPVPGTLSVSPNASVVALTTDVTLTASNWTIPGGTASDLPIQYSFAYQLNAAGTGAPALDAPVTVITAFKPLTSAVVRLPAGTLRLLVFAQSARGATTMLSSILQPPASVVLTVARPTGLEAEYAPPIVTSAVTAALAGQVETALQLAGGLATIFNANQSTDVTRLVNRANLLAAVGTAAVQAPPATSSAVAAVADALNALTTVPAELALGRPAAVAALGSVAAAGTLVSRPTAATLLFSLSNVSVSGVDAIVNASNASVALLDLKGILSAVGSLSSSLQAQLSVPGEAPVTLRAPQIQASIALDLTSNASRLFAAPITAPGAPGAAFSPLPPGALPASAGAAVNTSFHYMTFDPHSGAVNNGTGSARLLFRSGGADVNVSGLATPLTISLPPLGNLSSPTLFGQCTFWNAAQQAYAADGCVGLPNPLPPGLSASFNATIAAAGSAGAAELARSVVLGPPSSPLLAGCSVGVLDCAAKGASAVFFLNPSDPFNAPAVRCPPLSALPVGPGGTYATAAPALRVYYGANCPLWKSSSSCYWNATVQAFNGAGCVAATGPEQCLCRHLTDFSSFAFPQIGIATPAQMFAITPGDIITKLRFFLCVICVLFGVMHLGAAVGAAMDAAAKRRVLAALLSDAFNFEELPGGVWTWSLYQQPVVADFGAVAGPLVDLAGVIGIPFARLRCAVPEELLGGDVAHAVGRAAGLSVAACTADAVSHAAAHAEMFGGGGGGGLACCGPRGSANGVAPATSKQLRFAAEEEEQDAEAQKAAAQAVAATAAARVTSTALLFALIWTRMLLPREEMAERQAAAAAHFSRERTVAGSFDELVARFKDLLAGGNLQVTAKWLDKARLWRLILLQDAAGFWDPKAGLAFALQATSARPGASRGRPTLWQAPARALQRCIEDEPDADADADDAADTEVSPPGSPGSPGTPDALRDDPLHFSLSGALASVPRALRAATAEPPERVWLTLLCAALLEGLEHCYIVNGVASKEMEEEEVTMVDSAEAWLADVASRDAAVAAALPAARAKAARMTREWGLAQEERVAALRRFELAGAHRGAQQLARLTGEVVRAVQTKHETFSVFLAPPTDGLERWQRWMMMLTAVIGGLTVEVWFFQQKGATCCAQLRELVGCSADLGVPCRGFSGDCADLQSQFAELPPEVLPPGADVAGFECHAFPDDDNPIDKFFVGLIFAATAIPLRYILEVMLGMSNEAEHAEAWVSLSRRDRLLARLLGFRRFSWHYADPERRPNILLRLYARWPVEPFNMVIDALVDAISAIVVACARKCGCGCGCAPRVEADEAHDDGAPADKHSADAVDPTEGAAVDAPAGGIEAAPAGAPYAGSFPPTRTGTARILSQRHVTRPIFAEAAAGWDPSAAETQLALERDGGVVETEEEIQEAMEEEFENAVKARVVRATGLAGIYIAWGIFTWFIFAYGRLIYDQLGKSAENSFVTSWLVALGVDNASQWRDILKEAAQGAALLLLFDRLWWLPSARWLEEHVDHLSVGATLLAGGAASRARRLRAHLRFYAFVESD